MTENQTTGSSDSNLEANLPSIEVLYPASMEPPPDAQTISDNRKEVTGPPITSTVEIDSPWSRVEPAMRQTVDVEISSLRTHFEDCINATNAKLNYAEERFKMKLDNVEIKLNGRIEQLDKNLQSIKGNCKDK